ncbi:MAG TPA: phospholipase D-like domain-containing protein [Vicinamibacterales bacterium]|nr:phospholipase D-like domain-containing protein [Vicinamibacterales bacterium]
MKLIVQPDDGLGPLLHPIRHAKRSVKIMIFRFDRAEMEKALGAAVSRGVEVRALIAHSNRGGEGRLRKLELRLLEAGVTVTRTADEFPRYHGKMAIVDNTLYVLGFNYTKQDIEKSRSFGLITRESKLVKEAEALFESDSLRQPYQPSHDRLVVSPETSRKALADFISAAKSQLLIYDERITDKRMRTLLSDKAASGVDVRVLGKGDCKIDKVVARRMPFRLHVRAIVRDSNSLFVGSQSLRKLELDGRRELGLIVKDATIAKKIQSVFETDWENAGGKKEAKAEEKEAASAEKSGATSSPAA